MQCCPLRQALRQNRLTANRVGMARPLRPPETPDCRDAVRGTGATLCQGSVGRGLRPVSHMIAMASANEAPPQTDEARGEPA